MNVILLLKKYDEMNKILIAYVCNELTEKVLAGTYMENYYKNININKSKITDISYSSWNKRFEITAYIDFEKKDQFGDRSDYEIGIPKKEFLTIFKKEK